MKYIAILFCLAVTAAYIWGGIMDYINRSRWIKEQEKFKERLKKENGL